MLLGFHIAATIVSVCMIVLADSQALPWLRGVKETLPRKRLELYHMLMWVGLVALVSSGFCLFWPMREYLLGTPLFVMKLLFVSMLLVNGVLVGRLIPIAAARPFRSLSTREKLPLFVSGGVSVIGWISVVSIALYLFA